MEATTSVREATPGDAGLLAGFNLSHALEMEQLELDPCTVESGVRAVLDDPSGSKGFYLVAEVDSRPAGMLMVTYEWSDWRNSTYLWIQSVFVAPEFRRHGVCSALVEHVKAIAGERGCCGVRLYVLEDNIRARAVYTGRGMRSYGYLVMETADKARTD